MPKRARSQLGYEIYASDRTKAGLASVNRGFSGLTSNISKEASMVSGAISGAVMGNAAFAAAGAAAAITSFVASSIQSFARMEYKAAELFTLMREESETTKAKILDDLRGISNRLGQPIHMVIEVGYQVRSGGATPEDVARLTDLATQAAIAGRGDPGQTANLLLTTLNAFNMGTNEANYLLDILLNTVSFGVTDLGKLAPVLGRVNVAYADLGGTFLDVGAQMAFLTRNTGNTAEASTQLRAMVIELSREESKAGRFFKEAAGETFPEFIARTGDMTAALQFLGKTSREQGVSLVDVFSSAEAGAAASKLSGEEYAGFFYNFTDDAPGALKEMFDEMDGTTQQDLNRMSNAWSNFKDDVGGFFGAQYDIAVNLLNRTATDERNSLEMRRKVWRTFWLSVSGYSRQAQLSIFGGQQIPTPTMRDEASRFGDYSGYVYTQAGPQDWGDWLSYVSSNVGQRAGDDVWSLADLQGRIRELILDDYPLPTPEEVGGGGVGRQIVNEVRGLRNDLKSGQAITVTLDAMVDEGVILRTDTVERASQQIAARFGNHPVNRTRSG